MKHLGCASLLLTLFLVAGCTTTTLATTEQITTMDRAGLDQEEIKQCVADKGAWKQRNCECVVEYIRPRLRDDDLRLWLSGLNQIRAKQPITIPRETARPIGEIIFAGFAACGL